MQPYHELLLWQTAMDLAEAIYRHTRHFPATEHIGLTAEIRQSANAIPAHVADKYGVNDSTPDFLQALTFAQHSLLQLETQVLIANRLDLLPPESFAELSRHIADTYQLIQAFFNSLAPPPA